MLPPDLMSLSPASRRESLLVATAFAVLALVGLAILAPNPWEWDEVLFMEGVRDGLDVRVNHPHAPGYPVFIRLGQGIRVLGAEPFRATALAGAIGGYLSVLALYLLLTELGSRRGWALAGALFYALTPSVWLHGVRPLSDGPGAAAGLFAALFLVRDRGARRHALVGGRVHGARGRSRPQVGLALCRRRPLRPGCVPARAERPPLLLAVRQACSRGDLDARLPGLGRVRGLEGPARRPDEVRVDVRQPESPRRAAGAVLEAVARGSGRARADRGRVPLDRPRRRGAREAKGGARPPRLCSRHRAHARRFVGGLGAALRPRVLGGAVRVRGVRTGAAREDASRALRRARGRRFLPGSLRGPRRARDRGGGIEA